MNPLYQLEFSKQARDALRRLPVKTHQRVLEKIESLRSDPRPKGFKPLQGKFKGLARIRVGDLRVIYQVKDNELFVLVVKVADRKEAY